MNDQKKTGAMVAIGVVVAAVVGAILFFSRRSSADTGSGTTPIATPIQPPVVGSPPSNPAAPSVTVPVIGPVQEVGPTTPPKQTTTPPKPPVSTGPDPFGATSVAIKGRYCVPKSGDAEIRLAQRAGYTRIHLAYLTMRDHPRNAWIGTVLRSGATERQLRLDYGWAPNPGKESLPFAHMTEHKKSGGLKIPCVYLPTEAELDAYKAAHL
jgi:hypothetical protein